MQRLHEAQVLVEHGEAAEAYVRSQVMTKAFEAIGLPHLSVWERNVDETGVVIDFDGRPMHEKTWAALQIPVADFESQRRLIEHHTQVEVLDRMQPGEMLAEDSKHPDVDDHLAAAHGYHPELRYLMKRLYCRTDRKLILYNFNVPHGNGAEGINQRRVSPETTIGGLLAEDDPDTDYSEIEVARLWLELEARVYIDDFVEVVRDVGEQLQLGLLDPDRAGDLLDEYERGLLTLLLVKFNPDRAANLISADDLVWAESLLEFSVDETLLAAAEISNRNQLDWIACGGLLASILGERQEWYGAFKKTGNCVNCGDGPKDVGEKGWCRPCISGHCGK